jgi:hypothetical protein
MTEIMKDKMAGLPEEHARFLKFALGRLRQDSRLVGVAAGGSFLTRTIDQYSDLDLVIFVEPEAYEAVSNARLEIARSLGPLLSGFTGEHVGEPRLLICLYGPPLIHVDLKFVSLLDAARRVEDPAVLWERDGRVSTELATGVSADYPLPDPQWIEDRFWVWVHYGAGKIARGELFEALDLLGFLRGQVLGPLSLLKAGARPTGVRRIEVLAPDSVNDLRRTLADHDRRSCSEALVAAVAIYRALRTSLATAHLVLRKDAEDAATKYLEEITGATGVIKN